MESDTNLRLKNLKVDGGASRNNLLMLFQSDILVTEVLRPRITETTALGAAYLAGLGVDYWKDVEEVQNQWQVEHKFEPTGDIDRVAREIAGWHEAVARVLTGDKCKL